MKKAARVTGLKEKKQHGDQMFPVAIYDVFMDAGKVPVYLHWHEELEILFFTEGSTTFLIEGTELSLTAGDMLLVKPGALHGGHDKLTAPAAYRAILVRYEFLAGIGQKVSGAFVCGEKRKLYTYARVVQDAWTGGGGSEGCLFFV